MGPKNNQADQVIDEIAADNYSGAAQILHRAGEMFPLLTIQHVDNAPASVDAARQTIIDTCIRMVKAQPDMSPLLRLATRVISAARNADGIQNVLKAANDAAAAFIGNSDRRARAAAAHAATLIRSESIILTHSRSSTVLAAFTEARRAGRDFSVIATESRPMLEGRSLAQALNSQGIRVTLIADAAASLAMDKVDMVLIGADTITPQNLVNKIGTRMIALGARALNVPIYSVCDTSKFISRAYLNDSVPYNRSARELWPDPPEGVLVANRYFEATPLTYFNGIIAEEGTLSIEEAARQAASTAVDDVVVNALVGVSVPLR